MSETTTPTVTFDWVISAIEARVKEDSLDNVIKTIHWRYVATSSDGFTADIFGAQGFESPDPAAFIPYANLTKAQMIAWLEEKINVTELQTSLVNTINNMRTPQIVTLIPNFA